MQEKELHILWTSGDPVTAEHMVFMYAKNALLRNWWDTVTIIVWGAATKLVAEDPHIQELIEDCMEAGVRFIACIRCAENLGKRQALNDLGVTTISAGPVLTDLLQQDKKLLTI